MKFTKTILSLVSIISLLIISCGTAEKPENTKLIFDKDSTTLKQVSAHESNNEKKTIESRPTLSVNDIGEVMGKDGTAIFFYTKYKDKKTLRIVADHYRKLAIRNRDKNVYVNFFDDKPAGVQWKYPMSDKLMKCWLAEYVYSTRTKRDELRFIER